VLTAVGTYSGSKRWFTLSRTAGKATRPEWIYSQGFYFEPKAEAKYKISGFIATKKEKKRGKKLYRLQQPRKPGSAVTKPGIETPQPLANWPWPLLSP